MRIGMIGAAVLMTAACAFGQSNPKPEHYLLPIALLLIGICAPFVLIIRAHFGDLPFYTGPCLLLTYVGGVYGAFVLLQGIFNLGTCVSTELR